MNTSIFHNHVNNRSSEVTRMPITSSSSSEIGLGSVYKSFGKSANIQGGEHVFVGRLMFGTEIPTGSVSFGS